MMDRWLRQFEAPMCSDCYWDEVVNGIERQRNELFPGRQERAHAPPCAADVGFDALTHGLVCRVGEWPHIVIHVGGVEGQQIGSIQLQQFHRPLTSRASISAARPPV